MDKIKLINNTEYQAKDLSQYGDSINITVCGITDYSAFRAVLTPENLQTIEVISEGGALCAVFEGYTQVTGKFDIVEGTEGMDITIYMKKEDELLRRIRTLEEEVKALKTPGAE